MRVGGKRGRAGQRVQNMCEVHENMEIRQNLTPMLRERISTVRHVITRNMPYLIHFVFGFF